VIRFEFPKFPKHNQHTHATIYEFECLARATAAN